MTDLINLIAMRWWFACKRDQTFGDVGFVKLALALLSDFSWSPEAGPTNTTSTEAQEFWWVVFTSYGMRLCRDRWKNTCVFNAIGLVLWGYLSKTSWSRTVVETGDMERLSCKEVEEEGIMSACSAKKKMLAHRIVERLQVSCEMICWRRLWMTIIPRTM